MTALAERDVSVMLAFVDELRAFDDPLPFPPELLGRLQALIPSDEASFSELDPVEQRPILRARARVDGEHALVVGDGDDTSGTDLYWKLRETHPVCSHRMATGDWSTPLKVSDFATLGEFRRTPIYDALYRGHFDHWLDVGLHASATRTRVIIFNRLGADFSERDRRVLALLQPHLVARYEAVESAARGASELAVAEEGASEEARRVVLCSGDGVIEFGSPSSRALLDRYLVVTNGRLPAGVLDRRTLVLPNDDDDRRLTIRVARAGTLSVLLLDERDLRIERLTRREREILEHVALGRENDAIAVELGIASATVAKHLEHVYDKLGVRNRTAAAALLDGAR